MSARPEDAVPEICESFGSDRTRMMDIVRAVQQRFGCVDSRAVDRIAEKVRAPRVRWQGWSPSTPSTPAHPSARW